MVCFLLYDIAKYRRSVIHSNLKIAFPDYGKEQINKIARESVRHLSDLIFEMIKSISMSKEEMKVRFQITNMDLINSYAASGKPVFALAGHYANFDWTMVMSDYLKMDAYAVYKPIKNKKVDGYIIKIRKKFKLVLIPMKRSRLFVRKFVEQQKSGIIFIVSDQSPKPRGMQHNFTMFFNRPTSVFKGFEEMARENNTGVVYFNIEKIKRGFYRATAVEMTRNAAETNNWELTNQFFDLLEKQIRKQPEFYMWSHKRWKVSIENALKVRELSPQVPQ